MSFTNSNLSPKVSHRYDSLDSTNAAAVAAIHGKTPPVHGGVFITRAQTAGKGRGTNTWHSTPGANLTLSLVVYPDRLTADRLFALSQWAALAIAGTVRHFINRELGSTVKVKWPNDVYVGDRKIAGILIQNGLRGAEVGWSVVGIGLNVAETDFPAELAGRTTSLNILTNEPLYPEDVLPRLFADLANLYPAWSPPAVAVLDAAYHERLYRRDEPSSFLLKATGQRFGGIIRGVDEQGRLRVEQAVGRESLFNVGEIELLRIPGEDLRSE